MPQAEGPFAGQTSHRAARVAAVVLAAGEGTRFGTASKLLAPFGGRQLAGWAFQAASESGLDALVVVVGAVDLGSLVASVAPTATVVENDKWRHGQATSLRAAVDWCDGEGFDAAVVGLADQPLVPASAWRAVGRSSCRAPLVTATYGGVRRPPVRIAREVWPLLASAGDEGARALMRSRPELVGEVACEGDPADVDTVVDLRRHDPRGRAGGAPGARVHGRAGLVSEDSGRGPEHE